MWKNTEQQNFKYIHFSGGLLILPQSTSLRRVNETIAASNNNLNHLINKLQATIADKIYDTMSRSQVKLDRTRKL